MAPPSRNASFIKYNPSLRFNSGGKERTIKMVELPVDPLEPPKFKYKKLPRLSGSPLVRIMHSPARPVTVQDQQDWKIVPCISNWKNPKGYTIGLDKRLAADGRGLQEVQINHRFAHLSEALHGAENKSGEAVLLRSQIHLKEQSKREQELRSLAERARTERSHSGLREEQEEREDEERQERDVIRGERKREREREACLRKSSKSKVVRDCERDISEKVALGSMASVTKGGELVYDQRLFNQEQGMDSGYGGDDSVYNVYDKGLFHPSLGGLHRPKKDGINEELGGLSRDKPVEFEKDSSDPFGLNDFLSKIKTER
ncbi:hypothetical protein SELMODRAFT_423904 [Selaginella moellendorffii]|uniref:SKI-interacting protein SKIP SNW domain-containing protein n=1 Tax=Selaginella moellendorffii TaxID=88036 RepID=D8SN67_SELML|nr:SNW/SKI-interacting protein [Selaginella moellendorffii]EFJ14015.1 hypothetical protein SELMODRAFT_423904 [Selaginella moellendorffii]|eukprot:XP_002984765.1 SNW/SKI-interacting protein [Selaginella moellendorffii]